MQLDYETVQAIAVRSLTELAHDSCEQRPAEEIEREAHKFASVMVDVLGSSHK
jgi:hypothetical protein